MTPEQAGEWVDSIRFACHIPHGWTSKGEPLPMKVHHSRESAIEAVLAFAAEHGEPISSVDRTADTK